MKYFVFFIFISFILIGCSTNREALVKKQYFPDGKPVLSNDTTSSYPRSREYYLLVEEMPEPPGGIGEIQGRIVVPEIVKVNNISGMVYVSTFINETGTVDFVEIAKGLNTECDNEALRVTKETKFKPGYHSGKPLKTKIIVPIKF